MNLEVIAQKGYLGEEIVVTARNRSEKTIFLLSGDIFKCSIPVSFHRSPLLLWYLFLHERAVILNRLQSQARRT